MKNHNNKQEVYIFYRIIATGCFSNICFEGIRRENDWDAIGPLLANMGML